MTKNLKKHVDGNKNTEKFVGFKLNPYICSVKIQEGHEAAAPKEGCLFCVRAIEIEIYWRQPRWGYGNTPKAYPLVALTARSAAVL